MKNDDLKNVEEFGSDPDFARETIQKDMEAGMVLASSYAVGLLEQAANAIVDGRKSITLTFAGAPYEQQTVFHLVNGLVSIAQTIHAAVPNSVEDVKKACERMNIHKEEQ